jgi:hypothetical protein
VACKRDATLATPRRRQCASDLYNPSRLMFTIFACACARVFVMLCVAAIVYCIVVRHNNIRTADDDDDDRIRRSVGLRVDVWILL